MEADQLHYYKPQILAKAEQYGIGNVRVAMPKNGRNAIIGDVTLVVDVLPGTGWDFFSFADDMEQLLACDVSVLTDDLASDKLHKPLIGTIVPL